MKTKLPVEIISTIVVMAMAALGVMRAEAAEPAAQSAPRTLIDVGTSDAVFLVTIKAGVITVEAVKVVTAGTTTGGPVDPPPADVAKAFADAIAKVTEAEKVKTAGTIKSLVDPILASAAKGELSDIAGVKSNLPFVLGLVTMGKADWADFSTVLKSRLETVASAADVAVVLKAASDELGKVK